MELQGVGLRTPAITVSNHMQLCPTLAQSPENNSGAIGREFESLRARQCFLSFDSPSNRAIVKSKLETKTRSWRIFIAFFPRTVLNFYGGNSHHALTNVLSSSAFRMYRISVIALCSESNVAVPKSSKLTGNR